MAVVGSFEVRGASSSPENFRQMGTQVSDEPGGKFLAVS